MQAIVCHEGQLSWEEVDTPQPGAGEVLVEVSAAGVNRADVLQAAGHYPPPPGVSELLGLEISGHIVQLGEHVTDWQVGDAVVCLLAGGGYAQQVVVPAGQCMKAPAQIDLIDAAAIPEVAATVVSNLADVLHPDCWFLVHGGTGGIGSFAIQYAKARGAKVIATAGSSEKLDICRQLGADVALDYHQDWLQGVQKATGKHYADVILDVMGAKYLDSNVRALAMDGTLVIIGLQGGRKGELDIARLLNKRGHIMATSLRFRSVQQKAEICRRVESEVWPLYAAGKICLPQVTRMDLQQAKEAHKLLTSGKNVGKIVLQACR